jgi:hypothetical protein
VEHVARKSPEFSHPLLGKGHTVYYSGAFRILLTHPKIADLMIIVH